MSNVSRWNIVGIAMGGFVAACSSTIDGPGVGSDPAAGGASGSAAGGTTTSGGTAGAISGGGTAGTGSGGSSGTTPGVFVPTPSRLRRLTSVEYRNSVVDLLGQGTVVTTEFERDASYNNLTAVAASTIALSAPVTEQFESSALLLADGFSKDASRRQAVVGCTPSGASDETCLRSFVETFGRRAFRRPLVSEEVELYLTVGRAGATAFGDFWSGVKYATATMLQSPNFLYRTEIGISDATTPDRRSLDGYEVATRLSYLLWQTTPDAELLDAAGAGALSTPDDLAAQAERLLGSARAENAVVGVLSEMLRLGELDSLTQLPSVYPQVASPTLSASMRAETQAFLRDIVFARDADYREFFTSTQTFLNAELASLYGVAGPAGNVVAVTSLPADGPRAGYLGQASFLALNAKSNDTSPTFRGKFILETLMCNGISPPPNDVVTELPEKDPTQTKRDQLRVHQSVDSCAGCHATMDPMGLALEHFDGIGAYRETDRGMTIDATGEFEGVAFDGARGLGRVLGDALLTAEGVPETADCLVRNLYRVATGHLERSGDSPVVGSLSSSFAADGYRVRRALARLVASDGFRIVGLPE